MKPNAPTQMAQTVKQKAQQAAQSVRQGAVSEAQQFLNTAASQVTGTDRLPAMPKIEDMNVQKPEPVAPEHAGYDNMDTYRAEVKEQETARMAQLKQIIDTEMQNARYKREQEQQNIAKAQEEQMQQDKPKEEEKSGFLGFVSKAARSIKGRLGQVGKAKSEKGKAAKG